MYYYKLLRRLHWIATDWTLLAIRVLPIILTLASGNKKTDSEPALFRAEPIKISLSEV